MQLCGGLRSDTAETNVHSTCVDSEIWRGVDVFKLDLILLCMGWRATPLQTFFLDLRKK